MGNIHFKILALLDSGIPSGGSLLDSLSSPFLIALISIGLVIFIGLIYFIVNRTGSSSHDTGKTHRLIKSSVASGAMSKKSKRHKRRRRDHRKRNLTLSEAGGLPPSSNDVDSGQSKKTQNCD